MEDQWSFYLTFQESALNSRTNPGVSSKKITWKEFEKAHEPCSKTVTAP